MWYFMTEIKGLGLVRPVLMKELFKCSLDFSWFQGFFSWLWSKLPCWEWATWLGIEVASSCREGSSANNQQVNREPRNTTTKKPNSVNSLNELGSGFFPSQAFRWEHSLPDSFISALLDSEQRIQGSHAQIYDLQKLWVNKWVLFSTTKSAFVMQQ